MGNFEFCLKLFHKVVFSTGAIDTVKQLKTKTRDAHWIVSHKGSELISPQEELYSDELIFVGAKVEPLS